MSEGLSREPWNKREGPAQREGTRLCRESLFTDRSVQCSVARGRVGLLTPPPATWRAAGFGAEPQGLSDEQALWSSENLCSAQKIVCQIPELSLVPVTRRCRRS